MRSGIAYLSFTDRGRALAEHLRAELGGETACTRDEASVTLSFWTAENFPTKRALVYVGATGIAVRAIAPHLGSKAEDPAVVAVDEAGRFAVPLLSGHLGGANDLARRIASLTGGTPVITTATDLRGVFAVDEWARRQNCAVVQPDGIKAVSAKLLAGETIRFWSAFRIDGEPPEGVVCTCTEQPPEGAYRVENAKPPDVWVDVYRRPPLSLAPRTLVLGVGCRSGVDQKTLERRFASFCCEHSLWPQSFCAAATLDRKAKEPGLLAFCDNHSWPLSAYSPEKLRRVQGTFSGSAFVEEQTGVDNVCERAAVLCAGGRLLVKKYAGEGVTLAATVRPLTLDWRW